MVTVPAWSAAELVFLGQFGGGFFDFTEERDLAGALILIVADVSDTSQTRQNHVSPARDISFLRIAWTRQQSG